MRMVPGCAPWIPSILIRKWWARGDGTLLAFRQSQWRVRNLQRNCLTARNTVKPRGFFLKQSVPMDICPLAWTFDFVAHSYWKKAGVSKIISLCNQFPHNLVYPQSSLPSLPQSPAQGNRRWPIPCFSDTHLATICPDWRWSCNERFGQFLGPWSTDLSSSHLGSLEGQVDVGCLRYPGQSYCTNSLGNLEELRTSQADPLVCDWVKAAVKAIAPDKIFARSKSDCSW